MKVKRLVANVKASRPKAVQKFYGDILGLEVLMDFGWIVTYGSKTKQTLQLSFAREGGAGTKVPALSIEVDDVDEAHRRMKKARYKIEYPLTDEDWGVRRFFVRDPLGQLVNILQHL